MPLLLNIHGVLVYGFPGYLVLPDMADVWPLPDPDEMVHIA